MFIYIDYNYNLYDVCKKITGNSSSLDVYSISYPYNFGFFGWSGDFYNFSDFFYVWVLLLGSFVNISVMFEILRHFDFCGLGGGWWGTAVFEATMSAL